MNSITRRLFSTTSTIRSTAAAAVEGGLPVDFASTPIQAKYLPRVIQRRIAKQLLNLESSSSSSSSSVPRQINIQNPFLVSRSTKSGILESNNANDDEIQYKWKKPIISNRRQKQLLNHFPSIDLPFSPKSLKSSSNSIITGLSLGESRSVQWDKNTIINWTGDLKFKQEQRILQASNPEEPGLAQEEEEVIQKSIYSGRKKMFKGHKDERNKQQKLQDRQVRLDGMEKRIREWRQGRNDEKQRNRPSLPF
ncbi:uncharacterized protein L201_006028 [Kwoniella dendrophila CBS 6074]|uniref:Large ribosomal subunit protein mL59 domain-containing protein n=1 Tax=Kwoniella dendrophila CBS 6074 TaxID=1295534 RepID=A0AAX4K0L1_9TREE